MKYVSIIPNPRRATALDKDTCPAIQIERPAEATSVVVYVEDKRSASGHKKLRRKLHKGRTIIVDDCMIEIDFVNNRATWRSRVTGSSFGTVNMVVKESDDA